MAIPLNITNFFEQGLILETYLKNLANTTTSEIRHIPFTKAARDTGVWGLRKFFEDYETSSTPGPNFTPQRDNTKQTGQGQHSQKA